MAEKSHTVCLIWGEFSITAQSTTRKHMKKVLEMTFRQSHLEDIRVVALLLCSASSDRRMGKKSLRSVLVCSKAEFLIKMHNFQKIC